MSSFKRTKPGFAGSIKNIYSTDTLNTNPLPGKAGQIFAEMEQRLISGHYRFGEEISVVELVREFESSRQPVTVAINHLRSLGYLIVLPQVGCRVISPTQQEVIDFFTMLSKIESLTAGMAAERHEEHDKQLDYLDYIATQIESIKFDSKDHNRNFSQLVSTFHETIRTMTDSNIVRFKAATLWRLADFMMWQGIIKSPSEIDIKTANQERRAILEAIKSRDCIRAEKLMEEHILGKLVRVGLISNKPVLPPENK